MDVREMFSRLGTIRELDFEARSLSPANTGWNGSGRGTVGVERIDDGTLLFHEAGTWTPPGGRGSAFNNVFRWTRDPGGRSVRLEHLRFGPTKPVYLFDLVPLSDCLFTSAEPHACGDDFYSARMELGPVVVRLSWAVTGPRKDERIAYFYR